VRNYTQINTQKLKIWKKIEDEIKIDFFFEKNIKKRKMNINKILFFKNIKIEKNWQVPFPI
jgi:hypothetical protein